jgi:hypothetical protein
MWCRAADGTAILTITNARPIGWPQFPRILQVRIQSLMSKLVCVAIVYLRGYICSVIVRRNTRKEEGWLEIRSERDRTSGSSDGKPKWTKYWFIFDDRFVAQVNETVEIILDSIEGYC